MDSPYHAECKDSPFTRSIFVRTALNFAQRDIPSFPLKDKEPLTRHGFKDATTDPRRLHMWGNRYPGANIGIPTGSISGVVVVDLDEETPEAMKVWNSLPETVEAETGRGRHRYYRIPKGARARSRKLAPGLDFKGDGGYVATPPSVHPGGARYRWVPGHSEIAPLPEYLIEAEPTPQPSRRRDPSTIGLDTGPIPEGSRDNTLARIAGRLHDGTRSLDDLTAELLEINTQRCDPPLSDQQVLKVARSIHGREPCRPGRPKEVDELVGDLSDYWHGQTWKKMAKKSEARFARALIREGRKFGKRVTTGLWVEKSFRQMAEILGVHRNTVTNIVKRAKEGGWLRQDNADRRGEKPGAFVLVDPRQFCDTYNHPACMGEGVTSLSRPSEKPVNVADLTTPHHRHRGLVGYSKEHTLCVFEARGPLDRETAAELLGWARPRDLERLHLEPLCELGLLEKRDGVYAIPGDYAKCQESVLGQAYSTVQPRVRRERSVEGRNVYVVGDSGIVASESERLRLTKEQHARERDGYRNRAANPASSHYANVGADGYIEDLQRIGSELSEADRRTLEAIEAFEGKYGRGSFRWDRASCKELFYSGPIGGFWPEHDELQRIREYLAPSERAA
jgi:hypothetical protein